MPQISRTNLTLNRITKGAVLYDTKNGGGSSPLITSIYLRRDGFPTTTYPTKISVTVETDEDIGA